MSKTVSAPLEELQRSDTEINAGTGTPAPAEKEKPKAEKRDKPVPKQLDINQTVTVRNGFQGRLIYISKRTGEKFVWDEFGDEQEMELRELRDAKNSSKVYFSDNYFLFDEDWVPTWLGVAQFYKHALRIDEFDEMLMKPAGEIAGIFSNLSDGQKRSAAYRARQMIASGDIDSNKAIAALEAALGVDLVEK